MKNTSKVKIFVVFLTLMSCSSIDSDAEKMAELQCESIKITMGGALDAIEDGKMDMESIKDHGEKVQKFAERMNKKYEGFEEKQKFQALVMEKSLNNCLD